MTTASFSQQVVDFESVSLTAESYDNGASGSGDFVIDEITFSNYYNADYDYHNGFAMSNMTDVTTDGPGNQFSAYTGSGFNSVNFATFMNSGAITTTATASITEFKISNTTYGALSMLNGDAYGKQFGTIYAADGTTEDGTLGEDYFKVWVVGIAADGTTKDSVEVYLADYRFADDAQDYIVNTWETVDLTGFSFDVSEVNFRFESSDNHPLYGVNTPKNIAVDDVKYNSTLALNELSDVSFKVFPNVVSDLLNIEGESGIVSVLNAQGQVVATASLNGKVQIDFSGFSNGVYFVNISNENGMLTKKVIK